MRIDRQLNLVIPITGAEGSKLSAHSTPISYDVYKANWRVLSRVFGDIMTKGFASTGPRVAQLMLRDVAEELGIWEGPRGVERGLLAEIHRLTNVFAIGKRGWEMIPYEEARSKEIIDPEEADEIEGLLTFFTVGSHLFRQKNRAEMLTAALEVWGAQTSFLSCTEYLNSLPTLTAIESTGAKAAA